MQTLKRQALSRMAAFGGLRCPVCQAPLLVAEDSLRCANGHTYDVARKGYVHLHHRTVQSAYGAELFAARRAVFDGGFYDPVVRALEGILAPLKPAALLDAGCGEGFYLSALEKTLPQTCLVGVDLSKEAILCAAGRGGHALYCVGDLRRLPFLDHVFDVVLNILSPASYADFSRVLKRGGLLVKIMPGGEYLREIRERLPGAIGGYDDARVPSYLQSHMRMESMERHRHTLPISAEAYACFVAMTPLTQDLSPEMRDGLLKNPPEEITIDLQLAVCRPAD